MQTQNDNLKNDIGQTTQHSLSDRNNLNSNTFFSFATKKTEKLVTALYMVTDCMETGDALKGKLRSLGVNLMSEMNTLSLSREAGKNLTIVQSLTHITEISSLINIAATIGFVSEMNAQILHKEFAILKGELSKFNAENSIKIDDAFLQVGLPEYQSRLTSPYLTSDLPKPPTEHKHSPVIIEEKRTNAERRVSSIVSEMSFKNEKNSVNRSQKIMSLIKDKDNQYKGQSISIKDIMYAFTDCSEKTIQRELNTLVLNGQIKKIGEKRWSRYSL